MLRGRTNIKLVKLSQAGLAPILILIAAAGLIIFLLISSSASFKDKLFSNLFPKPASKAVTTPIVFKSSTGEILPTNASNVPLTTSPTVKIELTSSLGSPVPSPSVGIGTTESVGIGTTGVEITTTSYRIAESSADLDQANFAAYTEEPTVVDYTFKNTSLGSKVIWAEFKDSTDKTDIKAAQIELISAQASPTPTPTPSPTPTPRPTPTPSPTPTPRPTPTPTPKPLSTPIPKPTPTLKPAITPSPRPSPTGSSVTRSSTPQSVNNVYRPTYQINVTDPTPSPSPVVQKGCGIFCSINKIIEDFSKALETRMTVILEGLGFLPKNSKQLKSF